ncbi:MAG: hypothetical protein WDO14_00150 [Bacteroidota bacterium]
MLHLKILLVLTLLPSLIYCQSKKVFHNETIAYSKLAEIIGQPKWDTIVFDQVHFKSDIGKRDWQDSVFGQYTVANAIKAGKVKSLEFADCTFSESIFFEGNFEGNVAFTHCKGPEELVFENCNINALWISEADFQAIFLQHSKFKNITVRTEDAEHTTISFFKSSVNGELEIVGSRISIFNSSFVLDAEPIIENEGRGTAWTTVNNTSFDQPDGFLQFQQKDGFVQVSRCTFSGGVDFYGDGDRVTWNIVDNKFQKEVGFRSGAEIGPSSYINFREIYSDRSLGWHIDQDNEMLFYDGRDDQIQMERYYTNLLRLHKRFHDFYLDGGDIYSANILYVRIKDLETRHLENEYVKTSSFDLWVRIGLNKLLKFYTRYGTDPARAIVISLWVVFGFALFYVFFPSSWDLSSRSKLIDNVKNIRHFRKQPRKLWSIVVNLFVTILNAYALSLNAFVTLGFGEIPTKGFARYVTIAEGFLGWFLLTLFSVALISQSSF